MIFSIGILVRSSEDVFFISEVYDYSKFGYFKSKSVNEFMKLATRESAKNITNIGSRYVSIIDDKYPFDIALHLLCSIDYKIIICMITDKEYKSSVCKQMMFEILSNCHYDNEIMRTKIDITPFSLKNGTGKRHKDILSKSNQDIMVYYFPVSYY